MNTTNESKNVQNEVKTYHYIEEFMGKAGLIKSEAFEKVDGPNKIGINSIIKKAEENELLSSIIEVFDKSHRVLGEKLAMLQDEINSELYYEHGIKKNKLKAYKILLEAMKEKLPECEYIFITDITFEKKKMSISNNAAIDKVEYLAFEKDGTLIPFDNGKCLIVSDLKSIFEYAIKYNKKILEEKNSAIEFDNKSCMLDIENNAFSDFNKSNVNSNKTIKKDDRYYISIKKRTAHIGIGAFLVASLVVGIPLAQEYGANKKIVELVKLKLTEKQIVDDHEVVLNILESHGLGLDIENKRLVPTDKKEATSGNK